MDEILKFKIVGETMERWIDFPSRIVVEKIINDEIIENKTYIIEQEKD